ncbi:MAG: HlyD family type I secretion periplasmic adaptor subunit [Alphaproteobacteria bacterium]
MNFQALSGGQHRHPAAELIDGERLTLPASLESGRVPGLASGVLHFASLTVFAVIIWASFAKITEMAVASGELAPVGSVVAVEHLEGGLVDKILVREGQRVARNEALMVLRGTSASNDLEQLQVRAANLELQRIRLDALLAGTIPDFGTTGAAFPDLAKDQQNVFDAWRDLNKQGYEALRSKLTQKKLAVSALENQNSGLQTQVDIQRQQLEIRASILKEGFTSRRDYLDAKLRFEQAKTDLARIAGQLATEREAVRETTTRLAELSADWRGKLIDERSKAASDLAETRKTLAKLADRATRLVVRAPVAGLVQDLVIKSPGQVLGAGKIAALIVPTSAEVVAQVQVKPDDIGHIAVGQPVNITVTAYDPNVFGVLTGKISHLSPATFQTEKGETYYKAIVALDHSWQETNGKLPLLPGMVVRANIVTGAKSIMRYLLKPVFRSLDRAFSER